MYALVFLYVGKHEKIGTYEQGVFKNGISAS